MTPPEWTELARADGHTGIQQNFARSLDFRIRTSSTYLRGLRGVSRSRVEALVNVACRHVATAVPEGSSDTVHRLNKWDTYAGRESLSLAGDKGVPYSVLLYERYLGRPFASQRDSVSELVGEVVESAIEARLDAARITYRKTKRAERIPGFDQAPDFIIPDERNPSVVIEAKLASDDGTARDKVARVLRLVQLSAERLQAKGRGYEVVACIDGRGFGVRREDMRQLLLATRGKVFTLATLDDLLQHTELRRFLPVD